MRLFAATVIFASALACLSVFEISADWLDSCATSAVKNEETRLMDKQNQRIYFALHYGAMFLILLGNQRLSARQFGSVLIEAVVSHAFRYGVYVWGVYPVGITQPWNSCGTLKSVSGHAHMYTFHGVLLIYFYVFCRDRGFYRGCCTRTFVLILTLLASTAVLSSISKTFSGGYHSPRHMLQGLLTGILTAISYINLRGLVTVYGDISEEKRLD